MSPEFLLLLDCLGPERAAVPPTGAGLDWSRLIGLAERHRVMPALAAGLERRGIAAPPPAAQTLFGARVSAVHHEHALAGAADGILTALDGAGIRAGVLKGPPLSMAIHGRLGMRTSRDLDLLVGPAEVPRSIEVLADLGYVVRSDMPNLLASRFPRYKDIELSRGKGRAVVELHWRLFDNPLLLPLGTILDLSRAKLSPVTECWILPSRLQLLYLCNHGAQHAWSRLKWLADVAALLHQIDEDGRARLYAETSIADGRRAVGQTLLLCQKLFDMTMPSQLLIDSKRDRRLAMLVRIALRSLLASGDIEIEAVRFGSTRKNLSHYLIRTDRAYLAAEARFDLNDTSMVAQRSRWHRLGPVGRVGAWAGRILTGR